MQPTRVFKGLQYGILVLIPLLSACAASSNATTSTAAMAARADVRPGIDVLLSGDMAVLRGLRVGLITNHTGRTADGRSTIDALYNDKRIKLVALFGPEHGLRGTVEGGAKVSSTTDSATGLPIYSLYGATNKPTPEMLANVDALVFDIQDVGARWYTYPWTMTLAMKAAAEFHKKFVVLDRPNPVGGTLVQGNVNDTLTFVGLYPVPMRHGLTVGELAKWVNKEFNVGADLVVIKAEGWRRDMYYDQTKLTYVKLSPNMPSIESAIHYSGNCFFEGVNVSVGRGTPIAFQVIGAPWLDNKQLIARLESYHFPGVKFDTMTFTPVKPDDNKYSGEVVKGVRYITTDRNTYDPPRVAIATLVEIKKLHPDLVKISRGFDRLVGNSRVRAQVESGASYETIVAPWAAQDATFKAARAKYLLY